MRPRSRVVHLVLGVSLGVHVAAVTARAQDAAPRVSIGPNTRLAPGEYNEPWIAASSANRNVMIAAAHLGAPTPLTGMTVSAFISRDGGRRWAPIRLPGGPSGFDPMVASGPDGRLYVLQGQRSAGYIATYAARYGITTPLLYPQARAVNRVWSARGEAWSWEGPTEIESLVEPDHARMVADMSHGPRRGRLYIAWNDAVDVLVPDQYELFLQYSDDGGRTFTDRLLVDARRGGKLVATEPVVLSDGTLLVTYYQYFFPISGAANAHMPFFVRRSVDGGQTFDAVQTAFEIGPHVWADRAADIGAFVLPIVVADSSSASRYRDNVYVTWDDMRDGTSNIWFVRSTDKGRSWSRPMRINDNGASALNIKDYRMKPVVAVNHRGEVAVSWYDRRDDPTRQCWKYYVAVSTDGGTTFSKNRAISTAPSCSPPTMPPSVYANNLSATSDPNQPPDSVLARLGTLDKLEPITERTNRRAKEAANHGKQNARIDISFDPGRSISAGDYSALAADIDGVFHALWLDRRDGPQELYTARVSLSDTPRATSLIEQDVTSKVEVIVGTATFDRQNGIVRFPLQLRNVSDGPIHGPISVRVGASSSRVAFDGKLGSDEVLEPLDLSEPVPVSIRTQAATGWDVSLDVRVMARVPSAPALPHVRIATSLGEIEVEIDTLRAPITGKNFLRYVDGRFFHGGRFVRTVRADNQPSDSVRIAVIQAVIAEAREAGQFAAIPLERTSDTHLAHGDGAISMGRLGPNTAQSSFFICVGDQPALDFGGHRQPDGQGFAAFGRVVRGMDVVRRIHVAPAVGQSLAPAIVIDSITRAVAKRGASPS